MTHPKFHQLLDLVYETAVDPERWPAVLGRVGEMVGAHSAAMIQQDEATGQGRSVRWNVDPVAGELYYGYFATRNVLHNTPDPLETIRRWKPAILTDEDKIEKRLLLRSEYYNDFLRRFEMHSTLMVRLAVLGMDSVTINFNRPRSREQYGEPERRLARRLQPHLIRAFHLGRKAAGGRRLGEDLCEWVDRSRHGFILLNPDGVVRHVNRAARRFLAEPEGLRVIGGRLSATRPDTARALQRLIGVAGDADPEVRRGGAVAVPRPDRRPLQLSAIPLTARGDGPGIVVCVSDVERGAAADEDSLRVLFGVTRAEARLAVALFHGMSPQEAAEAFDVSRHTIHNQLACIFSKTDTRSQSDLMRLMARTAVPEG